MKMSELEFETHAFSLASLEQLGLESLNQMGRGTAIMMDLLSQNDMKVSGVCAHIDILLRECLLHMCIGLV